MHQEQPVSFKNVVFIQEANWPTPDSFEVGKFTVRGPCLLFQVRSGAEYNPVLPAGTILRRNDAGKLAIVIRGRPIMEGDAVTVKGGSGEYGRAGSQDPECAGRNFIVGGLREQDI